ncbi:MAG: C25 family cysteine peptidase [Candidatus Eisenbacteria bacterium]
MRNVVPFAVVAVFGLAAPLLAAGLVPLADRAGEPPVIEVVEPGDHGLRLIFEMKDLVEGSITTEDGSFQTAALPGGQIAGRPGEPGVPVFSRFVAVPEGAVIRVSAARGDEEIRAGVRLAPAPDEEDRILFREAIYFQARLEDEPAVTIGGPARIRDVTVVPITFRPVRYDAAGGVMKIARRLDVEIAFEGGAPRKSAASMKPVPTSFAELYRSIVLNADDLLAGREVRPGGIAVIYPDSAGILDSLQRYVEWRTRKGAEVIIASRAEAGGGKANIKSWIQSVYDDPDVALEYLVIVGDAGDVDTPFPIPCWHDLRSGYFGEGDLPYGLLEGDDDLADVHYGRLSFSTRDQLSIILSKTIGYETDPYTDDPDWFTRAVVVGDPRQSGISTVDAGRWLEHRLEGIGYDDIHTVYGGAFTSLMRTGLDRGNTVFAYRGFAGMSGWSNALTSILTNGRMLPFVATLTCLTGSFEGGTSISEGFLRAGTIGPFVSKGAVGAVGTATGGTHTRYNNCMHYGIWRGFTLEGLQTMGAALNRGRLEMFLNYEAMEPFIPVIWSYWNNLMGDPALDVFTSFPEPLTVTHPSVIPIGASGLNVLVEEPGGPCEGALVCLWKEGETHVTALTGPDGWADLGIGVATAGEMKVTVTKHDRRAYLASVPVTDTLHVGVSMGVISDDDPAAGAADGRINPGESIGYTVQLTNHGGQTVAAVTGTLTTGDPFITIVDGAEEFGDIPAGGFAWCADDFDFTVNPGCPDGHEARLILTASSADGSWESFVDLPVVSACLSADSAAVHDPDGRLDPGETAELSVRLSNGGGADATDAAVTLKSLSDFVIVTEGSAGYGTILSGGSAMNGGDRFTIVAAADAYEGMTAFLILTAEFSGGARDTAFLALPIGDRTEDDPAGPSGYGYWAFDDADTAYPEAPVFDWVELDPLYGGNGTEIVTSDFGEFEDETVLYELPFPFRYYGVEFDTISICTNGWISMGSTELISYRNWTIPGGGGPDGILAVFWDNLYQAGGAKIYVRHDEGNHRFIVQWSRLLNDYCGAVENFEVILFDPAFHPTDTGDGIILYQYDDITSCDAVNGGCTIGMGSPDQRDGLLVTYYGQYSAGSMGLADVKSIKFVPVGLGDISTFVATGGGPPIVVTGLGAARPNPFNPNTTLSFSLESPGPVRIGVYDVTGRLVRRLVVGDLPAGTHETSWDGRSDRGEGAASGAYFARMEAGGDVRVRRLMLVR